VHERGRVAGEVAQQLGDALLQAADAGHATEVNRPGFPGGSNL
jgi:hypothetical protein